MLEAVRIACLPSTTGQMPESNVNNMDSKILLRILSPELWALYSANKLEILRILALKPPRSRNIHNSANSVSYGLLFSLPARYALKV